MSFELLFIDKQNLIQPLNFETKFVMKIALLDFLKINLSVEKYFPENFENLWAD